MLTELRATPGLVSIVHTHPLIATDVAALLADMLQCHQDNCMRLAELLVLKTAGNPFFIKRLLQTLHDVSLIRFAQATRTWEWDLHELELAAVSDNVADLLTHTIFELPEATRDLLLAAGCIGHRFELATLAAVTQRVPAEVMRLLQPDVDDGLLLPARRPGDDHGGAGDTALARADGAPGMQFVHDRIQPAAYDLLPDARRASLHLAIGRHLLHNSPDGQRDDMLFDIVDQLNRGDASMMDPASGTRP